MKLELDEEREVDLNNTALPDAETLSEQEELQVTLGKCHATMASGVGTSVAGLGMMVGAGPWVCGAAGVAVTTVAIDLLAKESFGEDHRQGNSDEYPGRYGQGAVSMLPITITAGGFACAEILGAGQWVLGSFVVCGGIAYIKQRLALSRYNQLVQTESEE